MSSKRRTESSQANGRKSHGPKTSEGRSRSSHNAMRHGILSKLTLLPGESPENFDLLMKQYMDRFGTLDDVEFGFVEDMLNAYWRLRRCWCVEKTALSEAIDAQPGNDPTHCLTAGFRQLAGGTLLPLLHRYETRFHNIVNRSLRNLLLLQKQNLPNEPNPIFEHLPEAPVAESTSEDTIASTDTTAPDSIPDLAAVQPAPPESASPATSDAGPRRYPGTPLLSSTAPEASEFA